MDAEAVSSGEHPQTQCPVVLYKHTEILSLTSGKLSTQIYITEKDGGVLVLSWYAHAQEFLWYLNWPNKGKIQLPSSLKCSSVAFSSMKSGSFGQ